jgi:ribonuclease BN (tRNA processing enzyme)
VRLTVVGSSPAWPNPGSAHAGYLVESGGRRLLVDCGPGVLSRLREREGWPRVDAIAVTHCHLDHVGDLVPWLWGYLMGPVQGEPAPPVWLPPGGRDATAPLGPLSDGFELHEYAERVPFEAAGFEIVPIGVPHFGVAAFGLRVSDGAATIAFSGDSGPSEALAELADGANLFVCEATTDTPPADGAERGHLTASEAVAAAGRTRVLLTHRPVELPPPHGAEVAYDGLVVEL